jgi:hypothetical protein
MIDIVFSRNSLRLKSLFRYAPFIMKPIELRSKWAITGFTYIRPEDDVVSLGL